MIIENSELIKFSGIAIQGLIAICENNSSRDGKSEKLFFTI